MKILLLSALFSVSALAGETVLVPANPGGVDVCRDFIEYHLHIRGVQLNGSTPESMQFTYKGKVVGNMTYADDGSEAATCTVL